MSRAEAEKAMRSESSSFWIECQPLAGAAKTVRKFLGGGGGREEAGSSTKVTPYEAAGTQLG